MANELTLAGEITGALWIGIPVLSLLALCEWLFRARGVDGETTRKVSHVGAGLVVVMMPWAVTSHWTVLALAFGFALVLGGSKKLGLLPSVHRVSRTTSGAEYYPVAVYLTWLLASGDPLLYCVPMLVMAFSDTGAAIVGRRYGIVQYRVIEDYRSLGGSVTFFGLTFAVVLVGLGLAGFGDLPSVLLITLLTALVATAVEGISVRGADNLLVPYSTLVVLQTTISLDRAGLGSWVLGTALVLAVLLVSYRQSRLNATAFMAVFVSGVLAWGLGGPVWLATLMVPYVGFSASRPVSGQRRESDLEVMVPAFAVSLLLVLLYGHWSSPLIFAPFLASVASVSAIAVAGFVRARRPEALLSASGAFVGAAAAVLPALVLTTPVVVTPTLLAAVLGGALVGPLLVSRLEAAERLTPSRARIAGVLGGTVCSGLWLATRLAL
jgi:phytol kinase